MAEPTPPPGYEPIAGASPLAPPPGYEPVAAPGILESLGRGFVESATFGADDKLGMDKERREASRKANPWAHFMGELVGGAVPMAAAAVLPTGVGQAAAAGRAAQLLGKGIGLVRGALVPGEINTWGQAIGQGAKLGAVYGGLSGAGHADVHDSDTLASALQKRGVGAVTGAGTGAVVGPVLGAAGHGVYRGGQFLGGLRAVSEAETAGLGQGALKTATRKLEEDRITPQQLIDQIRAEFPDDTLTAGAGDLQAGLSRRFWGNATGGNKQPITADQVEETVRRSMLGENANDISKALKAANGGDGPGPGAVQSLLDELADRHLGPLNLVDRAGMVRTGAGNNMQLSMRAAAATPGEHLGVAREGLLERQMGAGGRFQQLFDKLLGSSDFDAVAARHSGALESAGSRAYADAFSNEVPFDLTPILRKYQSQFDGRRGPVPEGMVKALDSFTTKKPVTEGLTAEGRTQASELPLTERESLLSMWRYAHRPVAEPQSLSQWVKGYGGLKDTGGDLANMFGGMAPKGMIRGKAGKNIDDAALRAWEEGFFPGMQKRPTVNEFLEALERDVKGDRVVRPEHFDRLEARTNQQEMLRDLADVGVNARNEVEALRQLGFGKAGRPLTSDVGPTTLEDFIAARQNVKQLMDEAKVGSPLKRELTKFYNEITSAVADTNPKWAEANALWRDGKAAQDAMDAGARMSTRLGAASRENLAEFTSAKNDAARASQELKSATAVANASKKKSGAVSPAEQAAVDAAQARLDAANTRMELFKVGLVRALSDMMANQGETHNLARNILLPGAKKMLREVLGKDADQFFKVAQAEAQMHRTYQSQFGSQTTPLREAMDEQNWAPRFEASMLNPLSWGNPVLRLAQEAAARSINARRNTDLIEKVYTVTDPIKQLEALRAMQTLHTRRSTAGDAIGRPVVASGGLFSDALVGLHAAETAPLPSGLKPYRPQ